jgi:hypothetical protein
MEYNLRGEMNKFLMESGYKKRLEVAVALMNKGIYKSMNTAMVQFNEVIRGKRPASPEFLEGLERLSINSQRFMEIVDEFKEQDK